MSSPKRASPSLLPSTCKKQAVAGSEEKAAEDKDANYVYVRVRDRTFRFSRATLPETCLLKYICDDEGTSAKNPVVFYRTLEYFEVVANYLQSQVFHITCQQSLHLAVAECNFFGVFLRSKDANHNAWTHDRTHVELSLKKNYSGELYLHASATGTLWEESRRWTCHANFLAIEARSAETALELFVNFLMRYAWRILVPKLSVRVDPNCPQRDMIELVR